MLRVPSSRGRVQQLANISRPQTRQKLKEAYEAEFAATIERAEKQIILAKHGRRLLQLLDDTPVVPGDAKPVYHHASQARQVLNDAEGRYRIPIQQAMDAELRAARAAGDTLRAGTSPLPALFGR